MQRGRLISIAFYLTVAGWIYNDFYHSLFNWVHLPPLLLGTFGCWLAIDTLQIGYDAGVLRKRGRLLAGRLTMLLIAIAGLAAIGLLAKVDPRRFGFAAGDQTAIDIFVGVCAALYRYFERIRFSQERPSRTAAQATAEPQPAWRRFLTLLIIGLFIVWLAEDVVYRTWTDWSHAAPLLLGLCATFLVVDGAGVLLEALGVLTPRPDEGRLDLMIISGVGVAAALVMALTAADRFGFAAHGQTVIDIFVGVAMASVRYLARISLWDERPAA